MYQTGLADPHLQTWRITRAHLELAYGTWLSNHERRPEAAPMLHAALSDFTAIGALPWARVRRTR